LEGGCKFVVDFELRSHTFALSGDAVVNAKKGVFCIDEPTEGVALYRLDSGARIRTFPIRVTRSERPRQVSFTEDCSVIVSGSDHGVVYVFDRRSGDVVDRLRLDADDWIQTVTVIGRTCLASTPN
jgi:hypothetical protein